MKYLRKTLELGFSATILSTLLLTACGGGGGSAAVGGGTTGATGTTVTVTPVKGKFQGSCVVSISNAAGTILFTGTQAINANGTTTATLPTGSTGPFLVSIQGDAAGTCQYFNDDAANPRMIPMGAAESLNALVSINELMAASGVAITSLTEMAFQATSAVNGGHLRNLTENSPEIAQGIAAAVSLAGLTGASAVASIFTPPRTIPASGVAANDDMGRTLEKIASMNPSKPLEAVRWMSLHAEAAATSGVQSTALTLQANAMNASFVPAAGVLNYASQVAINTSTAAFNAQNAATTAAFLKDITTTGLRQIQFGSLNPSQNINIPASGSLVKATLANAVYTVTQTWNDLINRIWQPANSGNWVLGNQGWIDSATSPLSFAMNPDGTAKVTHEGYGRHDVAVFKQDLTGMPFASAVSNMQTSPIAMLGMSGGVDANGQQVLNASGIPTGANIVPTGAFTTGAIAYNTVPAGYAAMYAYSIASGVWAISSVMPTSFVATASSVMPTSSVPTASSVMPASSVATASSVMPASSVATAPQDIYEISGTRTGEWNTPVVGATGAALTALPALNTAFCTQNNQFYYQPQSGVAAGTYAVFYSGGGTTCWPAAAGTLPNQTFTARTVVVNGVTIMELTAPATQFTAGWTEILAVLNGKVYQGWKTTKGTPAFFGVGSAMANQAAATQLSNAVNLPMF